MTLKDSISKAFASFKGMKVLVVGDVMIDAYLWGKVERISPEAPVPIVQVLKDEIRPGGAANVAVNIAALGGVPILCSVVGDDQRGKDFIALLQQAGMNINGIVRSKDRPTTVKTRVIGNHHQLIRVDRETTEDINDADEAALQKAIADLIETEKPSVIILEDYDKGLFTDEMIGFVTSFAAARNIPVTVDPKKKQFNQYANVTLFKPNLSELRAGLKLDHLLPEASMLHDASRVFIEERNIKMVMVTLSEAGVFIADKDNHVLLPAHKRDISDVSGAGDTVISVASMALAAGLPMETLAGLSNLAGGLVCEAVGVVPIEKEKLLAEAISKL